MYSMNMCVLLSLDSCLLLFVRVAECAKGASVPQLLLSDDASLLTILILCVHDRARERKGVSGSPHHQ